jgi:AcrR family transcriptional regulator
VAANKIDSEPEDMAAELRAALARHRLYIYRVAARVRINPNTVSHYFSGRRALTQDIAQRLLTAIEAEAAEAAAQIEPAERRA